MPDPIDTPMRFLATMPEATDPVVKLWILRILFGSQLRIFHLLREGVHDQSILSAVGVDPATIRGHDSLNHAGALRSTLHDVWKEAEAHSAKSSLGLVVEKNVSMLGELLGLSAMQRRLVEFAVFMDTQPPLAAAVGLCGSMLAIGTVSTLAMILKEDKDAIKEALAPDGALRRSGMMSVQIDSLVLLSDKFDFFNAGVAQQLLKPCADVIAIMRGVVERAPGPSAEAKDFIHLQPRLDVLVGFLAAARRSRTAGVNILFHGPPGTGKTQLSRIVGMLADMPVYNVSVLSATRQPIVGPRRLDALMFAQRLLNDGAAAILVLDEAEDLFDPSTGGFFDEFEPVSAKRKGLINSVLESNPIPTIWISNRTTVLDEAILRRFSMIVEIHTPPLQARRRLAERHLSDLVPAHVRRTVAESTHLAPAILETAAQVLRATQPRLEENLAGKCLLDMLNASLKAQGHPRIPVAGRDPSEEFIDPDYLNASTAVDGIARQLASHRSGRLCLYGPSGTGKTAWAAHVARELDIPLLKKRYSDILSLFVGESERNIRAIFDEAAQCDALLLIDEADGLFRARSQTMQSWEVTLINEVLVQMESFNGILIATTNMIGEFDRAAMRRFDLKIEFSPLRDDQRWELLVRYCRKLFSAPPRLDLQSRLRQLDDLTVGDFATLLRRHQLQPFADDRAWVDALVEERWHKSGKRKPIGFVA